MIYLDNAATTALCGAAKEAMLTALNCRGNPSSSHAAGRAAFSLLEGARKTVAACLGARPEEIVFTSGGTEADNLALLTGAAAGIRHRKKHIVTTAFEHHAVLKPLKRLEQQGFEVTRLDVPPCGIVSVEQVRAALRPETCLVSVMYANNEIGTIQPVPEIADVCRAAGILFHTDAVQAAGQLRLDVNADGIDLLSASAHKFGGPEGAGFLYVRNGIDVEPLLYGGGQERLRRAGTENLPGIAGMAAALEYACRHMDQTTAKVLQLRDRLIRGLSEIPDSRLTGDPHRRLPGNVHFCFNGINAETLLLMLDAHGICAASSAACDVGSTEQHHVLKALGLPPEYISGALRLSLSAENTAEEIDTVIGIVREAVVRLRQRTCPERCPEPDGE